MIVPHSASFLGNPGHLQLLVQRVAAALVQSPPPVNWDGGVGGGGLREEQGGTAAFSVGAASAAACAAAVRLLVALFRLDRDALGHAVGSANLTRESATAVQRALSCVCPEAAAVFSSSSSSSSLGSSRAPSQQQQQQQRRAVAERASGVGGVATADSLVEGVQAAATSAATLSPPGARIKVGGEVESASGADDRRSPTKTPAAVAAGVEKVRGSPSPRQALRQNQEQQEQEQLRRPRQPLTPITPRDANNNKVYDNGGAVSSSASGGKPKTTWTASSTTPGAQTARMAFLSPSTAAAAASGASSSSSAISAIVASPTTTTTTTTTMMTTTEGETAEVARRLIAGLSPGARTHRLVEALSSLRGLADGGAGVGGRPEFWPRYFGQILMLLLEGAATGGAGSGRDGGGAAARHGVGEGGRSGLSTKTSRRRAVLRVKHVQAVRCLVARRGSQFPGSTEVVVGRLVEVGGLDPCLLVQREAEACLADLVPVLDPSRFLAVLTPMLLVLLPPDAAGDDENDEGARFLASTADVRCGDGWGGNGSGGSVVLPPQNPLTQRCVVLGALRALTPRLSSPALLGALGAGPLLAGLEAALSSWRDMEARRRAVLAVVEMYQVRVPVRLFWRVGSRFLCAC